MSRRFSWLVPCLLLGACGTESVNSVSPQPPSTIAGASSGDRVSLLFRDDTSPTIEDAALSLALLNLPPEARQEGRLINAANALLQTEPSIDGGLLPVPDEDNANFVAPDGIQLADAAAIMVAERLELSGLTRLEQTAEAINGLLGTTFTGFGGNSDILGIPGEPRPTELPDILSTEVSFLPNGDVEFLIAFADRIFPPSSGNENAVAGFIDLYFDSDANTGIAPFGFVIDETDRPRGVDLYIDLDIEAETPGQAIVFFEEPESEPSAVLDVVYGDSTITVIIPADVLSMEEVPLVDNFFEYVYYATQPFFRNVPDIVPNNPAELASSASPFTDPQGDATGPFR